MNNYNYKLFYNFFFLKINILFDLTRRYKIIFKNKKN